MAQSQPDRHSPAQRRIAAALELAAKQARLLAAGRRYTGPQNCARRPAGATRWPPRSWPPTRWSLTRWWTPGEPQAASRRRERKTRQSWPQGRACPDGGTCHHGCAGGCWRTEGWAGPLTAAGWGDRWPAEVLAAEQAKGPSGGRL